MKGTQASESEPELAFDLDLPGGAVRVRFSCAHTVLAAEARTLWSHLASSAGTGGTCYSELLILGPDDDTPRDFAGLKRRIRPGPGASYAFSGAVTRVVISQLIGRSVLLHAAAVDMEGLGVVIAVGPSGAGKSTAATALGKSGGYLTDELVVLDPESLRVEAYPKPVSRGGSPGARGGKQDVDLGQLGLHPRRRGGAPAQVLFLNRLGPESSMNADSALRRVEHREALSRLIGQSSSMWRVPEALSVLSRLLDSVDGAIEVTYRDAQEIEGLLRAALPARLQTPWVHLPPRDDGQTASVLPAERGYAIAAYSDAINIEDSVVVLMNRRAVLLQGVGALAWSVLRADGESTLARVAGRISESIGLDPAAEQITRQHLDSLVELNVVRELAPTHR